MRIAIYDHENTTLHEEYKLISQIFKEYFDDVIIETFMSGKDLIKRHSIYKFDVVFLEIENSPDNKFKLAEELNNNYPDITIIFLTNQDKLVFEALKFNPLRFIRKSHLKKEINEAVRTISKIKTNTCNSICIKTKLGNSIVRKKDIMYIESHRNNIIINCKENILTTRYSLSKIEKDLNSSMFMRIHSGYIVNFNHIDSINKNEITFSNGIIINISRSKLKEFKYKFEQYIKNIK